jgi:hypothetical protein
MVVNLEVYGIGIIFLEKKGNNYTSFGKTFTVRVRFCICFLIKELSIMKRWWVPASDS